ncbi:DUF5719 family protein [Streptomyces sp. IBSBF 2806]|uniref:DUF5719 family protein n=1 Tax=Streptomyces sp. IBSBF 2806 TaxID=2903529 RepID=UPI002FDC07D8
MNRTTLSLIAGTAALAAVTGFATLNQPDASGADSARAAAELPVERTSLLCPAPSTSELAETSYTSFTPVTKGTGADGKAELTPAAEESADPASATPGGKTSGKTDGKTSGKTNGKTSGKTNGKTNGKKKPAAKPALTPKAPGAPAVGTTTGGDAPALLGTAEGSSAPGWTVQQTTEVPAGSGRGLQGLACSAPDTEFWFPGVSTAADRSDYVHLTNPDDSAAVVDIALYGKDGALETTVGEGLTVPAHSSEPILLSTLTGEKQEDLTVHVNVRSGRLGAAVQALDEKLGGDWLAPATDPAPTQVVPGIPKDATAVRLVAYAPGDADADLKVQLASPSGLITPAGHETLHVKAGRTISVDLGDVTRGEAGSLVLTPTDQSVPVVAAVRVLRGKGADQESAFIPATAPVGTRASAAGNSAKGATLSLTAPKGTAQVKVTASAGSGGGTAVSKTYTVRSGTTQDVELPVPSGLKGNYALTVETLTATPVYASRTLTSTQEGVPGFTVQTLPDDRGMVSVPQADEDVAVLQK